MPSADFCRVIVFPYGSISPHGQRSRSPGVSTHLSAHERKQRGQVFILDRIENNGFAEPQNAQDAKQRAPVIFMYAYKDHLANLV
jgi:hypothetical protein